MVLAHSLISNSSSPLTKPLGIVPNEPIIIGITFIFMFQCVFSPLARFKNFCLVSFSLIFTLWSAGTAKSTIWQVLFFSLNITRFGRPTGIRWSVCISKSKKILRVSFSRTDSSLCMYYLLVLSNFNLLYTSKWITFPTLSCLVLYSFVLICSIHSKLPYHVISLLRD